MTYFMTSPLILKCRLCLYHNIRSKRIIFLKGKFLALLSYFDANHKTCNSINMSDIAMYLEICLKQHYGFDMNEIFPVKDQQKRELCLAQKQRHTQFSRAQGRTTGSAGSPTVFSGTYCLRWTGSRRLFTRGKGGSSKQQTLEDIAKCINEGEYQRIVVMVGAGISTPSGIPDFRSPGSGLYDNLQQYDLPYAEAIFEINFFHHKPEPFFALAKELYPGNYQPNLTHYFVRLLHDKGQLLRMYTQNIDGLERLAGIPTEMLVEAHGTFATATCTVCRLAYKGEYLRPDIMEGKVPKCPTCRGVVKPDIVFFGEELPHHFFKYLKDFPLADLLIVMGTSLEVEPFASLAGAVRKSVPRLLINRDLVGPFAWGTPRPNDVSLLGDVVGGVRALSDALGWTVELENKMADYNKKAPKRSEE